MSKALSTLVVALTGDISEFEKSMKDASGSVESMGSKIAKTGATIGTGLVAGAAVAGAALVALGASSVGVARDFESSMTILSTAVDPVTVGLESSAQVMEMMGNAALQVGSDMSLVGVSASGAADSITGLYKAGMTTGEIFGDLNGYMNGTAELGGALRASIDLAAASELDMVAASELAAITLATFGSELTTTEERAAFVNSAMNNFVQTADASVASVQSLADAFKNVGPSAAAMGIPMEHVNVALGILSTRGIQGAEAGTALKSMLVNLTSTTPAVTDTLTNLGISLYDMDGAMRPLPAIIADLESGMAGMTEEQRNQTIVTLAGTYGMNAMNALLGEGTAGWESMEDAIGSAATMQETAAARANTLQGAQEALAGVVETLQIKVGTALIPVLTLLADIGASLIERFGPALVGGFETFADIFSKVAKAVGDFILRWQNGVPLMMNVTSLIMQMSGAFGLTGAAAVSFGNAVNVIMNNYITPLVNKVSAAISSFISWQDVLIALGLFIAGALIAAIASIVTTLAPIILVIAGVIAAVALLRTAWEQNWGGIQEKTAAIVTFVQMAIQALISWWNTNWPTIQTTIQTVWANVQAIIQAGIAWWNSAWPTIQTTLQTVWTVVQTIIQTAISIIGPAIQGFIESARASLGQMEGILAPLKQAWLTIQPVVMGVLQVLGGALLAFIGVVIGVVNGIISALGPLVQGFVGAVQGVITVITGLATFFRGFFELLKALFTGNTTAVKAALEQMKQGIITIWQGIVQAVTSLVTGFVAAIKAFIQGLVQGVITFFRNMYNVIVGGSIVPDMVNAIIMWFQNLSAMLMAINQAIQAFFIAIWNAIKAFMTATWQAIVALVTAAINTAKATIMAVWNAVKAFWLATWNAIKAFTEATWNALKAFITASINSIRSTIMSVWNAVKAFWESTWNAIKAKTEATWNAIKSFTMSTISAIRSTIQSFISAIQSAWTSFTSTLQNIWQTAWNTIGNIMRTGQAVITGIANAIVAAIFAAFNKDWGAIGRGIVDGIGNALAAGLAWVAQKAKEIAEAALEAAKRALGIGSPSRMFEYLGEMSIRGYTEPFENTRPIEMAVVRAMEAGLASGSRQSNQTINRGVTIGQVNMPGSNGMTLLRQMEALGVRR